MADSRDGHDVEATTVDDDAALKEPTPRAREDLGLLNSLARRAMPSQAPKSVELILAVVGYMAVSAGMLVGNKLVLRQAHLPITVCTVQMAFTVATLLAVPSMRRALHFGSARDAWRWTRAQPPLFALMLVSSMLAIDHASMGSIIAVRNLAPIPSLFAETCLDSSLKINAETMLALLLSVSGVLLYTYNDAQSSYLGLALMGLNLCAAVTERVVTRKLCALQPIDISTMGMSLLSNIAGGVLLVPLIFAFGEAPKVGQLAAFDRYQWMLLLGSCVTGVAISYMGIHVQKFVTASSFMVMTNSNKFVVIAFGIFVLGESRSWQAVLGCTVALMGGVLYANARASLEHAAKEPSNDTAGGKRPNNWRNGAMAVTIIAILAYVLTSGPSTPIPGSYVSTSETPRPGKHAPAAHTGKGLPMRQQPHGMSSGKRNPPRVKKR